MAWLRDARGRNLIPSGSDRARLLSSQLGRRSISGVVSTSRCNPLAARGRIDWRFVMHRLTPDQKRVIAERAAAGVPSRQIAREIGRAHRTVHDYVEALRRRPPKPRCRSDRHLSLAEREEISRGLVAGDSIRSIATGLGRDASTVCREVNRNGGRRRYRAPVLRTGPGRVVGDRNRRDSRPTLSFGGWSRTDWDCSGHRSRSHAR